MASATRAQPVHPTQISASICLRNLLEWTETIFYAFSCFAACTGGAAGPDALADPSLDLARSRSPGAKVTPVRRNRNGRRARSAARGGADVRSATSQALPRARDRRAAPWNGFPAARRVDA